MSPTITIQSHIISVNSLDIACSILQTKSGIAFNPLELKIKNIISRTNSFICITGLGLVDPKVKNSLNKTYCDLVNQLFH